VAWGGGIGPPSWEQGPPTGEPGPTDQNEFFLTKGLYYRQKYSSVSSAGEVVLGRRGWHGYSWPVVVTAKFSKMALEAVYGREINIQFSGNSSGGYSCSQHAKCSIKTSDTCGIVSCDKTANFRVAFYFPQLKVHMCNDHGVLSASVRWVDYLGKGEMLTNRYVNKCVHNILEK
jgi:hypothetical protein